MSFFDISNLANKFAGFDIPPDTEFEQRSDDYGYTQTSEYEGGYDGQPPSGYPCGPQEGENEYRSTHPDYSTSDTTRNGLGEGGTYSYNPSSQELDEKAQDAQVQTPSADPDLPEGWTKKFDERYNRWYFVNEDTGETQWHQPGRDHSEDTSTDGGGILTPATTTDDPSKPWYHHGTHGEGGEAGGYYSGNQYQANTPYETGAFSDSRGMSQDGNGNGGEGQRSYGGGEAPAAPVRSSSGYGKTMLGVAGGLAVGAAGGAILAHALDSDDDDEDEVVVSAQRSTAEYQCEQEMDPEEDEEDDIASSGSEPELEPESESEEEEEMEPVTRVSVEEEDEEDEPSSASDVEEESDSEPEEELEPEPEEESEPEPEAEEENEPSQSSSASEAEEEEEEEVVEEDVDEEVASETYDDGGGDYSGVEEDYY